MRSERWLTTGAAATLLGMSETSLQRAAHLGQVVCRRTPGGWFKFERSVVEGLAETFGDALSLGAVAERCGVPPDKLRDWLRKGRVHATLTPGLQAVRTPSGRLRYSPADVERLAAALDAARELGFSV